MMWVPIEGGDAKVENLCSAPTRRLRTRLMEQPIMHCLVSVRADEAAAWSLKRTLLRDSPGDLQWGVKGARFREYGPENDHWCSFPPGAGVLGGSFSGRSQRFSSDFDTDRPTRRAQRRAILSVGKSDRSTHLSQIRGRKAYLVPLTCNAYVTAA
eukprot:scaffold49846_cov61-Phaeocystis_antarctica.AAC.1